MTKRPNTLNSLRVDLAAANREVRMVMDKNTALEEEAAASYERGYKDAISLAHRLARVAAEQGSLLVYFTDLCKRQPNSSTGSVP